MTSPSAHLNLLPNIVQSTYYRLNAGGWGGGSIIEYVSIDVLQIIHPTASAEVSLVNSKRSIEYKSRT